MNKTNGASTPMLLVTLPRQIIVPTTTDLNGLFATLGTALVFETVYSANDQQRPDNNNYLGEYTYWANETAVPSVCPAPEFYATSEEAQAARNQTTQAALAVQEQRKVEAAKPSPDAVTV